MTYSNPLSWVEINEDVYLWPWRWGEILTMTAKQPKDRISPPARWEGRWQIWQQCSQLGVYMFDVWCLQFDDGSGSRCLQFGARTKNWSIRIWQLSHWQLFRHPRGGARGAILLLLTMIWYGIGDEHQHQDTYVIHVQYLHAHVHLDISLLHFWPPTLRFRQDFTAESTISMIPKCSTLALIFNTSSV